MQIRRSKYSLIKRIGLPTIFFCYFGSALAQNFSGYIWPIDSPFVITGNYGELRPNHFHAGIDFSTAGKINLPVYSIEEGYVSRIRVSANGYGKCVYITHPRGKVSVYAHLNAFSLKIANKAKEHQYGTQSYEIDFMPKPRTVYVRKNEIIGLSGNTGSSTGPHLHFEIRDELSETPLNPLGFFRVKDNTPPEINALAFYNLSDTSAPQLMNIYRVKRNRRDSFILDNDHIVLNQSIVAMAFSGFDRYIKNGNTNNIFAAEMYVDDSLVYSHCLDSIPFSESRFINEFCEAVGKNKFQKCFVPTLYPQGFFEKHLHKGRLILNDKNFQKIRFVLLDESGNKTAIQFFLKAKQISDYQKVEKGGDLFVNCVEDFRSDKFDLSIHIPAKTLFYSTDLIINNTIASNGKLSIFPEVNIKQPITLGFRIPDRYLTYKNKLLLMGSSLALPVNRNDSVFFSVKDFGKLNLTVDTISPKIKIDYSERRLKEAWQMDAFSFKITDNLSGIEKYNLWLNNSWVLSEYDSKENLLTYYFDEDTPIGILNFKLEVLDRVGNKAFLEFTLKK